MPRPAFEDQVKALVRQLGDDEFSRREAAEKVLLRLGVDILPVVDRLGRQEDAEIRSRLARLRHELAGFRDDIRAGLAAMPEIKDETRPPIPASLKQIILDYQPRSGDFLLSLLADVKEPLHRRATNAFLHTWDSMTAAQIKEYLRHILVVGARPRPRYPRGIDASIALGYSSRYDYSEWPAGDKFRFVTRTSHFLDGKPHGKPYPYEGMMACTGWIQTKDLSIGKHSCSLELDYEFIHCGAKYTGQLRSRKISFSMIPADTPDDLIAPKDAATERLVRKAFAFGKKESDFYEQPLLGRFGMPLEEERRPNSTWVGPGGKRGGLAMVLWNVATPLPIDLCFDVALHDQKTGKVYPCDPLVLRRGKAQWGYISPRAAWDFARGRVGEVPVKVVLTPSRKAALTSTEVTRYYPGSITSEILTIKVFGEDDFKQDKRKRK